MTDITEIPLTGGNVNTVVRVGNTVRRNQAAASASIHRLLTFLHDQGFHQCPKFLGVDDKNREILSFIPGQTDFPKDLWTSEAYLIAAADMLKTFHATTAKFTQQDTDVWLTLNDRQRPNDVICHNDFAPYNFVYSKQGIEAVVDFDLASPGNPLMDVAYAAYWMVPLSFSAPDMLPLSMLDIELSSRRLKQFCAVYGTELNISLLDVVEEKLLVMSDEQTMTQLLGLEVTERLKKEGHLEHWRKEHAAFKLNRVLIENNFP